MLGKDKRESGLKRGVVLQSDLLPRDMATALVKNARDRTRNILFGGRSVENVS
jgi:hypothetical protein